MGWVHITGHGGSQASVSQGGGIAFPGMKSGWAWPWAAPLPSPQVAAVGLTALCLSWDHLDNRVCLSLSCGGNGVVAPMVSMPSSCLLPPSCSLPRRLSPSSRRPTPAISMTLLPTLAWPAQGLASACKLSCQASVGFGGLWVLHKDCWGPGGGLVRESRVGGCSASKQCTAKG